MCLINAKVVCKYVMYVVLKSFALIFRSLKVVQTKTLKWQKTISDLK
jgi:hypothetical protein